MSEQVRSSFKKWDSEGRGIISKDEFSCVLRFLDPRTTDSEINALLSAVQINHDDKVNYERFVNWLFCEIPDAFSKLGVEEFNAAAENKCLWEVALSGAIANASKLHPKAKVDNYFADVRTRLSGQEFTERARRLFSDRCRSAAVTLLDMDAVATLLDIALIYAADMEAVVRPTSDEIRVAFDSHDAQCESRGSLDVDAFMNLVRHLQVQVALATLLEVETRTAQALKQLKSDKSLRERGLWEEAVSTAVARGCQKFDKSAVEAYFKQVRDKLSGTAYAEHVKGPIFAQVDTNKDGKVEFTEAYNLINSTLQCAADLGKMPRPKQDVLQEVFEAHDTIAEGWDFMGGEEFLNLMRYLQVQVAEAMMPFSQVIKGA